MAGRRLTPSEGAPLNAVRLDVWLDVSCLFKTRSEAQRACKGGKVDVNGQAGKPHRMVHAGDQIEISRPFGAQQSVVIVGLAERSIPKAEARRLYDDRTPQPTSDEIAGAARRPRVPRRPGGGRASRQATAPRRAQVARVLGRRRPERHGCELQLALRT